MTISETARELIDEAGASWRSDLGRPYQVLLLHMLGLLIESLEGLREDLRTRARGTLGE